ncbi:protoporphyrinogen oxidase HemJ [Larsenimonas suaedae]|uniref:Protoporphyrinogen IX oxidase n=1 Tax=Larsenimonas suaedae TaxID=1851019 RepID=A0ABU1GR32_9GAMM|nr:protoporphyrinogen oxidase HemJ [Larsenimonas suaedae]MCM2972715.1 protoporphyrinogen oxidase HemJ [Larsenimonas suaedae]MDR5894488.1 protoporphyrinogen oxidase HemJ [Larsenimonas suaedae]
MFLWVKAFHLISLVVWFAALFYLPRLFVYHTSALKQGDEQGSERFKLMERKLYRGIMTPGMIATLVFGLWLVVLAPGVLQQGWFYAKLALVVALIGFHHMCLAQVKRFAADETPRKRVFYQLLNGVPVLVLVAVVILSVVNPF